MIDANEQKQILDMLAEGKITAEEAQRLLEKLQQSAEAAKESGAGGERKAGRSPRHLRVIVNDTTGEQVNLRIPIGLARAGLKVNAMLPEWVHRTILVNGVDLSGMFRDLEGDELNVALNELDISVDSPGGETVRIFCE